MTSYQQFIIQVLSTFAVLVPVLVNAFKTWKNASDSDTRLKSLEAWQQQQDSKLQAIKEDTSRGFKEQGEHRYKLDQHLAVLEDRVADTKRRVEAIPSRSEYNYQRPSMDLTPLPTVAPKIPELDELEEFNPKRRKR